MPCSFVLQKATPKTKKIAKSVDGTTTYNLFSFWKKSRQDVPNAVCINIYIHAEICAPPPARSIAAARPISHVK